MQTKRSIENKTLTFKMKKFDLNHKYVLPANFECLANLLTNQPPLKILFKCLFQVTQSTVYDKENKALSIQNRMQS